MRISRSVSRSLTRSSHPSLVIAFAAALTLPAWSGAANKSQGVQNIEIITLSSNGSPGLITGGDVLVALIVPPSVPLDQVQVRLNMRVITSAFRVDPITGQLTGLVTGLRLGPNTLGVRAGSLRARTDLINHPITGPLFAGPHELPFGCETDSFMMPVIGGALGPPLDEFCSITTRVDYIYRSLDNQFKPLSDLTQYPADLARTVTLLGTMAPYIVRMETGTVNRAIYQIAILHDPIAEPAPDAFTRPAGWNNRLIYTFGGGCTGGWFRQGASTGGVIDDVMLRQGYAVASASLNVFGNNCNDLLAAETMDMVKERFIKAYGVPQFTMGFGCSGGSYQQHQIADNYPGLLDGIIPGCSFPEVLFATVDYITDARLLKHYFEVVAPGALDNEQQRRVTGFLTHPGTMNTVALAAGRISPFEFCPPPSVLPLKLRYDPISNPAGARCDVYDHTVNALGRDPLTGFARRPLDNVGIQYGLGALNQGVITVDQFLDLNERIGGYDKDANFIPQRTVADIDAVRAAYQTGRLTNGGLGLSQVPIIDYRAYTDDNPVGDIHLRFHSFSMRQRLIQANGTAANQVMLQEDFRNGYYSTDSPVLRGAINQMDRWLVNLSEDLSSDPRMDKIVRAKPADLEEACWTRDPTPVKIVETQQLDGGQCAQTYPVPPPPRGVAGEPLTFDRIKCQLKPVDPADYRVPFTPFQWSRLETIFKNGVCDYSRPGVEQQPPLGSWLTF